MKPKVLLVLNRLNIGGLVPQVLYLTKYLQDAFETKLICGAIDDSETSFEHLLAEMGVEAQIVPHMHRAIHPLRDYRALQHIKKVIRAFQPDVVHTHAAKSGALGRLAAAQCGVPVIVHTFHGHVFHSYFGPTKTRVFLEIERWLAQKSSKIIAISQLQKKDFIDLEICEKERIEVIYNGYPLERFYENIDAKRAKFREVWQIGKADIVVGIVGRIVPIKNHTLFLKAIKKVQELTQKTIRAVIIGDGEDRANMEALATDLELSYTDQADGQATVIFTSWILDVADVYPALDVACLTSLNEGTPNSLIEAQAAGVPIVSTDVGGVRDTVLLNENVLLSPSKNVDALVKNLVELIGREEVRTEENRRFVVEKFGIQRMIEETKGLYVDLLRK